MTSRFILITTAAILIAGCERPSAQADAAKSAEISAQRQVEQAANDKIRQLEERLNAADQQKAADREAELARVREDLAQVKKDKEAAAERIRELQAEADRPVPPPIAEAPAREAGEPRGQSIRADLERVVEEDDQDDTPEEGDPVYVGRVVPETQRVTNVEAFYEPLDQYGDWIQTDDYGYVFRPEVSHRRDWRPYTDGRWVHTGHGWTWQSNEDFGWATYHYGRWTRVERAGWVWVPGREWGPGWVSWRRGRDECGWAPLPPESRGRHSFTATVDRDYDIGPAAYVFIALSNFGARSYAPVIERPERNVSIINQTVNVTNITYNNVTNNTVVYNGGPSYEVVRARSKQPVENVQVNFASQAPAGERRKIVNVRQGNNFQIAAPPAVVAANTAPPRVKERLGKAKLDKGWDGVDAAQAQKVKQGIAATSTERPRRPRAAAAANPANPAAPKPGAPAVTAPPAPTARPERPAAATPAPVKTPADPAKAAPATPKPGRPVRTPAVDKSKPLDPDTAKVKAPAEAPPKLDQPIDAKKPAGNEAPKTREPEPARPTRSPETPPKPGKLEEPKKPVENETPKTSAPESPNPAAKPKASEPETAPIPKRETPKRREAQPTPVVRERPQRAVPTEAPARVKPQAEAPARVRQVNPERPVSPPAERRPVAAPPERPAPVSRPVEQAPRKAAPPERPRQETRAPEPRVNRPVQQPVVERAPQRVQRPPAPAVQRPQAPAVQRPPQPPAAQRQPPANQPQKAVEKTDGRKKKKDSDE